MIFGQFSSQKFSSLISPSLEVCIHYIIHNALTEKSGGLNIRNYLAHGLIEFDQLTPEIVSGILFILLQSGLLSLADDK